MAAAGHLALYGAIAAGLWAAVTGDRRAGRAGLWLAAGALVAAVALLAWALVTNDYSLAYVAGTARRGTAAPYRLAGLWGGMAGSLLLWTAGAALVGVAAARRDRDIRAVFGWLVAALTATVVIWADPFQVLPAPALDGRGLQPILEHPAMLYHPPLVYLGLVLLAAPYAITVAAHRLDDEWLARCRRWMGAAWVVLLVAMAAGAHWAYAELGWGGYWAWDPVENTALLPWLAATAFLHWSVRAREGGPRTGTGPALVLAAFVLALLGTLLTRSGAAPSVHAFAQDDSIGRALLAIVAVAAAVGLARGRGRATRADASAPGRAQFLRAQFVVVIAILLVVLAGTVYPVLVRADVAVAGHFFAAFAGPLAVVLLALMAVGPHLGRPGVARRLRVPGAAMALAVVLALVAGWHTPFAIAVAGLGALAATSAAALLRREHTPAHLAHVGVALLLLGIAGTTTAHTATVTLAPGAQVAVGGYRVRNDGARAVSSTSVEADVTVLRGGHTVAHFRPALSVYPELGTSVAVASLRSTPRDDVQVLLRNAGDDGRALLVVHVIPLMVWVWWGALVLAAAGAWAFTTRRESPACARAAGRAWPVARPAPPASSAEASAAVAGSPSARSRAARAAGPAPSAVPTPPTPPAP
jgi:cytochrome c-type biogenesis protein CcmF